MARLSVRSVRLRANRHHSRATRDVEVAEPDIVQLAAHG
jgi:hypothetical protein